jgi:hypothetical protein
MSCSEITFISALKWSNVNIDLSGFLKVCDTLKRVASRAAYNTARTLAVGAGHTTDSGEGAENESWLDGYEHELPTCVYKIFK